MFPRRYFPGRLFAPRFFPQSQGEPPAAADPSIVYLAARWHSPALAARDDHAIALSARDGHMISLAARRNDA